VISEQTNWIIAGVDLRRAPFLSWAPELLKATYYHNCILKVKGRSE